MLRRFLVLSSLLIAIGTVGLLVMAQDECPALVNEALSAIGDNCSALDRNSACYGFARVDSTFNMPQPADYFTQPRDRARLIEIDTLQTYPLDLDTGLYGAAVLNVQANVPNTLPGQGVIFLLLGDAQLQNAVPPEEATEMMDPVTIQVPDGVTLYTLPTLAANARFVVPPGSTLETDGRSADLMWLRVIYENEVVWAPQEAVTLDVDVDSLPVIRSSNRTPMQAFYFTTGIGRPQCNEAEPMLAIQSPEGIKVDLTVNGVDIRVGSFITFMKQENNLMLTVHQGSVQTTTGETVNSGETIIAPMDSSGNATNWGQKRQATEYEQNIGQTAEKGMMMLAQANNWPMPEASPTPTPTPTVDPSNSQQHWFYENGLLIHIVQPGETLFSIATLHRASMPSIVSRNNLTDPQVLFAGTRLIIPNPGTGFVGLPDTTPVPPDGGDVAGVDCSAFRLISPLGTVPVSLTSYSWTAAPGADDYDVRFYNYLGEFAASYRSGGQTQITLNTGQIPTGSELYWEVHAYKGGQYVCTTGRTPKLVRGADNGAPPQEDIVVDPVVPPPPVPTAVPPTPVPPTPVPPTPIPVFSGTAICPTVGFIEISYVNLPAGDTSAYISYTDRAADTFNEATLTGPSGTLSNALTGPDFTADGISITALPSGQQLNLGTRVCQ